MDIDRIDDDLATTEPEFDGGPLCNKDEDAKVCTLNNPPAIEQHFGPSHPESQTYKESIMGATLAVKETSDKPRLELLAPYYELGMARVMAKAIDSGKYREEDWRKGRPWREYLGAAKRHLNAMARGEDIDPHSGELHAYHLGCCAMILSEYMRLKHRYQHLDNRYIDPDITAGQCVAGPTAEEIMERNLKMQELNHNYKTG